MRQSASNGARWLMGYEAPFLDPGILWAVHDINQKFCQSEKISSWAKSRFDQEFSAKPILKEYRRLIDETYTDYRPDPALLEQQGEMYDDMLLPSLYCDRFPLAAESERELLSPKNLSGYDATHQLLATYFLFEKNDCVSKEKVTPTREKLVSTLLEEEKNGKVGDLYAERMVLLYLAGEGKHVRRSWLKRLVNAQKQSGVWPSGLLLGRSEDPHATALAVWALSEATRSCPF